MSLAGSLVEHADGACPDIPRSRFAFTGGAIQILREPVPYSAAWALQSRLHAERVRGVRPDTLLIMEHQPVYTLGRMTKPLHWGGDELRLKRNRAEIQSVNRGGSVTYHGPGQIVAYPIMQLARNAVGPRQFIHLMEEVIIHALQTKGIGGHRVPKQPGVWTSSPDERKIAFIGLRVERGVTLHGLALNVDLDLTPFEDIIPCGLTDCRVTSMAEVLGVPVPIEPMKQQIARSFTEIFSGEGGCPAADGAFA
jgi:lipoate-protein ligase B